VLRLLKVRGESLYPEFRPGDYVLILRFSFPSVKIKVGDIIAFDQPHYGLLIKRVREVLDSGRSFDVRGSQIASTDSRNFGPVPRDCVLGKVIWHIKQQRERQGPSIL
jgi:nickel-type superoxide dismutase maturation protease